MNSPQKVLIIDDDPVTVNLLAQLLKKSGYTTETASDGQEGLEKLPDFQPHLVVCDIVLPKIDGFAFCRDFVQDHPQIPLIIVSSKTQAKDAFLSMGSAVFFSKPIDSGQFLDSVAGLIGPGRPDEEKENAPAAEQGEPSREVVTEFEGHSAVETARAAESGISFSQELLSRDRPSKGKKVLVVDDEPAFQEMMRLGLVQAGYTVEIANNGEEGLSRISAQMPDLIIADVLMPVMDGYAFYRELKTSKITEKIPVIMLTARSKLKDSFEALGAEFFVTKPFDPDGLLNRIDQLMEKGPSSARSAEETPQKETAPEIKNKEKPPASEAKKQPLPGAFKVFILGHEEKSLREIVQHFESGGCELNVFEEAGKIVGAYNGLEPGLIVMQVSLEAQTDKTVAELTSAIKAKKRENETAVKNKKTKIVFKEPAIVIFKVSEEVKVGSSGGTEDLVAMEDLIQRCQDNGATKYIGLYSAISFPSKIRDYLKV